MDYQAGLGKSEITCFIPGIGMMGYGQPHNIVKEVATDLFARVLILEDPFKAKLIIVHLEQAFITMALKEELIKRIHLEYPEWKITDAHLIMIAQHTHSAPGGYGHYPFYNFTIPGFNLTVFQKIITGVMSAIKICRKRSRSCRTKLW